MLKGISEVIKGEGHHVICHRRHRGEMDICFESFLSRVLDGYSAPLACPLTLEKEPGFLLCRRLGEPRCLSGQVWERGKSVSHRG